MSKHDQNERVLMDHSDQNKNNLEYEPPDTAGDRKNLAMLCFFYVLQGVPLGLSACIPMMLQKRGASYQTQAAFSIVWWPYDFKLLWAPIVDSCYVARFGRRKSWMVPMQYMIGLFMIAMSYNINQWLGEKGTEVNIRVLGVLFFFLTMMAATQDIAVDGWSLTLLKRRNVGYASVCQTVGQPLGVFLGYGLLMPLESAEFCNTWLRSTPSDVGILTFSGYLRFWGIVFIIITTFVAIFKHEQKSNASDQPSLSIIDTYRMVLKILNIPAIRELASVLLIVRITWAASDGVAFLKFLNSGISNDKMISLSALTGLPIQLLVAFLVARFAAGSNPIHLYIIAIPFRTFIAIIESIIVYITPTIIFDNGLAPNYIYFAYLFNNVFYMAAAFSMFTVLTAFFVKISDPSVGATYMTLLNTLNNIGSTWPPTLALWMVEYLTIRNCGRFESSSTLSPIAQTEPTTEATLALSSNNKCPISLDGYYVETAIGLIIGLCLYKWIITTMRRLQSSPLHAWRLTERRENGITSTESIAIHL